MALLQAGFMAAAAGAAMLATGGAAGMEAASGSIDVLLSGGEMDTSTRFSTLFENANGEVLIFERGAEMSIPLESLEVINYDNVATATTNGTQLFVDSSNLTMHAGHFILPDANGNFLVPEGATISGEAVPAGRSTEGLSFWAPPGTDFIQVIERSAGDGPHLSFAYLDADMMVYNSSAGAKVFTSGFVEGWNVEFNPALLGHEHPDINPNTTMSSFLEKGSARCSVQEALATDRIIHVMDLHGGQWDDMTTGTRFARTIEPDGIRYTPCPS